MKQYWYYFNNMQVIDNIENYPRYWATPKIMTVGYARKIKWDIYKLKPLYGATWTPASGLQIKIRLFAAVAK